MKREMLLNISLTPVIEHDMKTNSYIMYYKEFPNAVAVGDTVDEAELNLIPLVEMMWREKPRDLAKILVNNYINNSHRNNPQINITNI